MKELKVALLISLFTCGLLLGMNVNTNSRINMRDVVDIETTETGALITLSGGDGYYWER